MRLYLTSNRDLRFLVRDRHRLLHIDVRGNDIHAVLLSTLESYGSGGDRLLQTFVGLTPPRLCSFNRLHDLRGLLVRPEKPIRRPDAVDDPSVCFEDALTQSVAVTRRTRRMVLRAVTFDTQHKTSAVFVIRFSKIDVKPRSSDLKFHVVAK